MRLELSVTREHRRQRETKRSVAPNMQGACTGLHFAASDRDVVAVEIASVHRVAYELDGETRERTQRRPLITFTRAPGGQCFANGRRAWFDTRDAKERRA